jgi:DNA-binding response OmpR family regulator
MNDATQQPAKILLIEDEKRIADFLQRGLESNNYAVEHTLDGTTGL